MSWNLYIKILRIYTRQREDLWFQPTDGGKKTNKWSLQIKLKEVEENPATEQSRISVGSDLKQNDMARKNLALQISKNRLSSLHKSSKNVVIRFLER